MSPDLGDLANPNACHQVLDIRGLVPALLRRQLRAMLLIRRVEEVIGDGVAAREVICPAHLGIGQEAVAVGVAQALRPSDRVFGGHRSHAHYLALGGDVQALLAEILGKEAGCSRGMGGSMHLFAAEHGLLGTVPIVAGTVPLAAGAALAAKKDGRGDIAVAFFGDGATEEGVVHESLNLAAAWRLPLLFVCENNLFSSHLHISLRQSSNRIARFAEAHGIRALTLDGNDLGAVARATLELTEHARAGGGPAFLEAVTYRWRGHVGHREDEDVGVNRGADLALWKGRDPVRRLAEALKSVGELDEAALAAMTAEVAAEVMSAWDRAKAASYPDAEALLERVYLEPPACA